MKKIIISSLIVIAVCLSVIYMMSARNESSEIKEIYKIFYEKQDAFKKKDYERLWQFWPDFERTDPTNKDLEKLKLWVNDPELVRIVCREKIEDVIFITPKRAVIKVIPPCFFGGYYLIKEKGRWKISILQDHYLVVAQQLQTIAQRIIGFRAKYGRLPAGLKEIVKAHPEIKYEICDLFDDKGKPYRFVISQDAWKLYSLGPDSDDDGGNIIYNPENGLISDGDIVLSESNDNKIFKETIEKFTKIKEETR